MESPFHYEVENELINYPIGLVRLTTTLYVATWGYTPCALVTVGASFPSDLDPVLRPLPGETIQGCRVSFLSRYRCRALLSLRIWLSKSSERGTESLHRRYWDDEPRPVQQ